MEYWRVTGCIAGHPDSNNGYAGLAGGGKAMGLSGSTVKGTVKVQDKKDRRTGNASKASTTGAAMPGHTARGAELRKI